MILHAEQLGQGRPSVVFLHGLLGDGANLRRLAHALADTGQVVLLMDLRNHGRSGHASDMGWAALAVDVHDTLHAHGLGPVHVIGHSLGGKVAMRWAEDFPAEVRSLVVLDIAPVTYPSYHQSILVALQAVDASLPVSREAARARLLQILPLPAAEVDFFLKGLKRTEAGHYRFRANLEAIMANYDGLRSSPLVGPAQYRGPVLFLAGEQSAYLGPAERQAVHAMYPQAGIHVIAQSGHWLHAEQTGPVAVAITSFWTGLAG